MRIGYVANAFSLGCKSNRRFRLASYSPQRFADTVESNLACLGRVLQFNAKHSLRFYRISSDLIPFASHPVCRFDWTYHFRKELKELGSYIRRQEFRISVHPGQYTILNAPNKEIVKRAISELHYHCTLLESLALDATAKIQIHIGGLYGDKQKAMDAFCSAYDGLDAGLKSRLVIENDDVRFTLRDCLELHSRIGIPVVLDTLHHECLNNGEPLHEGLSLAAATWKGKNGPPMVDYSSQEPGRRRGVHAETMDVDHFRNFLSQAKGIELDVMLELRDKDLSALKAIRIIKSFR